MSHNIDHIFYINLDRRTDRREEIDSDLAKYGLNAERFTGIPHNEGIVGCGQSHLAVMKLARERGYKNVLILEDDFTFIMPKEEFEQALSSFFDANIEYDVCMFSCNMVRKQQDKPYPFLDRIVEASNACAYIINHTYLDTLIALYDVAIPLLEQTGEHWIYANDQVWKKLQKDDKWFCFSPRLGKQRSGYSDNAKRVMDYDT